MATPSRARSIPRRIFLHRTNRPDTIHVVDRHMLDTVAQHELGQKRTVRRQNPGVRLIACARADHQPTAIGETPSQRMRRFEREDRAFPRTFFTPYQELRQTAFGETVDMAVRVKASVATGMNTHPFACQIDVGHDDRKRAIGKNGMVKCMPSGRDWREWRSGLRGHRQTEFSLSIVRHRDRAGQAVLAAQISVRSSG